MADHLLRHARELSPANPPVSAPDSPLVSIIIATYNRSNVLSLAIKTVLWQTFQRWELWVVGDACTDDTEQVVLGFGDPRIHYLNLPTNIGEQSGPNNEGTRHARGDFIAYLNHDDLWLPDHLEKCLDGIVETGADLVFTLVLRPTPGEWKTLNCSFPGMRYEPPVSVPASCWLFRRELIDEIGSWRFYQACYLPPSQDWMFRAWKANKKLYLVPHLTVVAIGSRVKPGTYVTRDDELQRLYFDRIRDETDFRERELTHIAIHARKDITLNGFRTLLFAAMRRLLHKGLLMLGIHPREVSFFLRYRKKGGLVDELRRDRGLRALARGRTKQL